MTSQDVIARAEMAFAKQEALREQMRAVDAEIRQICRDYGSVMKVWAVRPEHVKFAVEARKGMKVA